MKWRSVRAGNLVMGMYISNVGAVLRTGTGAVSDAVSVAVRSRKGDTTLVFDAADEVVIEEDAATKAWTPVPPSEVRNGDLIFGTKRGQKVIEIQKEGRRYSFRIADVFELATFTEGVNEVVVWR